MRYNATSKTKAKGGGSVLSEMRIGCAHTPAELEGVRT